VLSAADATAVAARVDGVIAVIDRRRTDTEDMLQLRSDLERAGGRLVGAVMNRERRRFGLPFRRDSYAYERAFQKAS
jgi:Mrp family chromosome partitioning ATPase